jgi:hypothetical protein
LSGDEIGTLRRPAHDREVGPVGRVEVEDQPVGLLEVVGARREDVRRDAVLVRHEYERRGLVGQRHRRLAAVALDQLDAVDPLREVERDLLDEDAVALEPARVHEHRQRPVLDVRHHRRTDAGVVLGQVELRDAVVGEDDAV